ncbi:MAG: hypothetical protein Q7S61_01355 [bacterium]|nr:hypothetical protein [bacterium]
MIKEEAKKLSFPSLAPDSVRVILPISARLAANIARSPRCREPPPATQDSLLALRAGFHSDTCSSFFLLYLIFDF